MSQLNAAALREFNECAERNLKRIDSAIQVLKQQREMLKSQQDQMIKDDTSAMSLRAIDLIGYSQKLDRVQAELDTASTDMGMVGRAHDPSADKQVR